MSDATDTTSSGTTDGNVPVDALAKETDPTLEHVAEGETYTIRRYRPRDKADFCALHEATESLRLGGDEAWFDWKFVDPPALSHVPIFVAERDGDLVGARPFVSFRLRAGPRTAVGLQTGDTMVHPDHRGRGLFSRLNELAFAYYRHREPALMFSMPNERSRPAYLDTGARVVSPIRNYLRVETPSSFVDDAVGRWAPDATGPVLDTVVDGYQTLRDRRRNGHERDGVTVERQATVPVRTLAELAERAVPDEIHVRRDEPFYQWRFENPGWTYDSYVARRDGSAIAAMVTATRDIDGRVQTRIADVVPLAGTDRHPGIAAILDRLLNTMPDTDVFTFAGRAIPDELLRTFGFRPDDELPLAPLTNPTVLITMPLGPADDDPAWTLENRDLTDPDNWLFPYCEHNTG